MVSTSLLLYRLRLIGSKLSELGRAIVNLTKIIPDGLVVFFPSYAYLDTAVKHWKSTHKSTKTPSQWNEMADNKFIFLEPKSTSTKSTTLGSGTTNVHQRDETHALDTPDKVLAAYTAQVNLTGSAARRNGALLLAVIGGSLSEGINFSDALGRGVVVVGLPFPNSNTPEWKARLEFVARGTRRVENQAGSVSTSDPKSKGQGDAAAKEYLENTCMRAVNQSVGRAIRHKDDYAAIVLLDRRYERLNIREKLPGWIKESLKCGMSFGQGVTALQDFFQDKQSMQ